MRELEVKFEK
ncbi:unnamed protein product, partial [Rotaria sordida]